MEFGTRDGLAMAHLLTDYVDAFLQEAEIEKSRAGSTLASPPGEGNGGSTDTPKSTQRKSAAGSAPLLTKSPSLPPPPPPPRPTTMAAPQRSSVTSTSTTNPLKSSSAAAPVKPREQQPSSPLQVTAHHHKCATKIQSLFRGFSLRNEWMKEDAVILIQAAYRGYAERCRVVLMLEELFQSGQLELLEED